MLPTFDGLEFFPKIIKLAECFQFQSCFNDCDIPFVFVKVFVAVRFAMCVEIIWFFATRVLAVYCQFKRTMRKQWTFNERVYWGLTMFIIYSCLHFDLVDKLQNNLCHPSTRHRAFDRSQMSSERAIDAMRSMCFASEQLNSFKCRKRKTKWK